MTRKGFWLDALLRLYAWAVVAVLSLVALFISYGIWTQQRSEAERVARMVLVRTQDVVEYATQTSQLMAASLTDNPAKLEGIYKFFSLTPSQYASWRLNHPLSDVISLSLHANIDDLYRQYDFVDGIAIALNDYQDIYVSTRDQRSGRKVAAASFHAGKGTVPVTVYDSNNGQVIGTVFVTINEKLLQSAIQTLSADLPLAITVTSPYDQTLFAINQSGKDSLAQGFEGRSVHDYQIKVAYSETKLLEKSLRWTFLIFLIGLILSLGLYLLLRKVFGRYQRQVADIVERIQEIGAGQSDLRIETRQKVGELSVISRNTNRMLDSLEKQLRENYELELNQKDAQMRALQAQINPHFLYNTLEFIRMYAVLEDQEELATLIYEFASLFRNNISDEGQTRLEQEFEFCRKYSYLCMMRYPHRVAYGYQIEEGLGHFVLPKFSIQPLVENYFVHGIDHQKTDNALSVKARRRGTKVEIIIKDNGHGLSPEKLEELRQLFSQRRLVKQEGASSIGIRNVHERLLLFFKDRYHMEVESKEGQGVIYRLLISDEGPERRSHAAGTTSG